MVNIAELRIGEKVYYQPKFFPKDKWENGLVKEIPDNTTTEVRVVYNCAGDWEHFKEYTSQLTSVKDLYLGWRHHEVISHADDDFDDRLQY